LALNWGLAKIQMPQAKCRCGGNVRLKFQTVRPRQRIWEDLRWEIQAEYRRGLSYRQIKVDLDQQLRSSVGLRTLNQQVLAVGTEAGHFPWLPKGQVPPVVRVDGIWITVMCATGETKVDQMGRQARQEHRTGFMRSAARIWQAPDESEARQRFLVFCEVWKEKQTKAIQTRIRDLTTR
jgi:hypothetical protein